DTATRSSPQTRRSLAAYSNRSQSASARRFTSSTRFLRSPLSASLCPDSDPPPASSGACSHPATASPPAPRLHPSRHTSLSTHRWCASTPPLLAPHLPLSAPLPVV